MGDRSAGRSGGDIVTAAEARGARAFVARIGSTLGWYGLASGLIALIAFGYGLGMLAREYNRPRRAEREVLHRVFANWIQAPDYLGRNLVDYARDWSAADLLDRDATLRRVREALRRLGDDLEAHDAQFPLIHVIGLQIVAGEGGEELAAWAPRFAPSGGHAVFSDVVSLARPGPDSAAAGDGHADAYDETHPGGIALRARYRVAPEVNAVVEAGERYYDRMVRALVGLSGASLLCFGYTVLHVLGLRDRVAWEAARGATLDLADRTCHELGNVAFVVANERRNLAGHIALIERFVAEEPEARRAATRRAGLDAPMAARLDLALAREYADRGIDPSLEIRRSTALARDVCRQIALCADYITLTVRELDGFLKHAELPVVLGPIAAAEVLDEAIALIAPRLDAADARINRPADVGPPVVVVGDRRLLVHAILNLLKNAVEAATGAGIVPEVAASARRDGGLARIEIADNGPGIAEPVRRRIFESGISTKGPGRGRGLAIALDSARLLGGRLEVGPRPGGGTIFALILPSAPVPAPGVNPPPSTEPTSTPVERPDREPQS